MILWILHLAVHGVIKLIIIENVEGIVNKRKRDLQSFASWFVDAIHVDLPPGWLVSVIHANSNRCSLPQSRPRVFFVGAAPAMRASSFQRRVLNDCVDL